MSNNKILFPVTPREKNPPPDKLNAYQRQAKKQLVNNQTPNCSTVLLQSTMWGEDGQDSQANQAEQGNSVQQVNMQATGRTWIASSINTTACFK